MPGSLEVRVEQARPLERRAALAEIAPRAWAVFERAKQDLRREPVVADLERLESAVDSGPDVHAEVESGRCHRNGETLTHTACAVLLSG